MRPQVPKFVENSLILRKSPGVLQTNGQTRVIAEIMNKPSRVVLRRALLTNLYLSFYYFAAVAVTLERPLSSYVNTILNFPVPLPILPIAVLIPALLASGIGRFSTPSSPSDLPFASTFATVTVFPSLLMVTSPPSPDPVRYADCASAYAALMLDSVTASLDFSSCDVKIGIEMATSTPHNHHGLL